eukprot:11787-Heterococcus_DN1.PRE.2
MGRCQLAVNIPTFSTKMTVLPKLVDKYILPAMVAKQVLVPEGLADSTTWEALLRLMLRICWQAQQISTTEG